jgi:hypothetical protein
MVLTIAQQTAFFEEPAQMGLTNATRVALGEEGIVSVDDLSEFDDNDLKQIASNLRRPAAGNPLAFGAKSQNRLKAVAKLLRYYEVTGRTTTAANVRFDPVVKRFTEHWQALTDRKKEDVPDIPKISRALPVTKWTESFVDFLNRTIGVRTIPLVYVVRADVVPPLLHPPLAVGQPYAEVHGSVEAEMIARASHTHALYRDDNAKVYYYLEEATRTTTYAASIKPFQRRKDGRAAWFAMVQQYAGVDKWQAELKRQDELLHSRKWKAQSNLSLEKFIAQHRNAYVSMTQCADHVNYQLPNEGTRVTYLLDAIECNDAPLQAAMALVRNDTGLTGKMNDFEATASFILPHCPVAKKRTTGGTRRPDVANVSDATASMEGRKVGIGTTGVELRYHELSEYKALTDDQRDELREHRKNSGDGKPKSQYGKGKPPPNKGKGRHMPGKGGPKQAYAKKMRGMVAEAVAKELASKDTDNSQQDAEKQLHEYLVSLVEATTGKKVKPTTAGVSAADAKESGPDPKPAAVTLSTILKRVQIKKGSKP